MNIYQWQDKSDTWFINERGEAMWGRVIEAIQWYWSQTTLLSVLILLMLTALIGLAWLQISDRKKGYSRAYWRGRKDEKETKTHNSIYLK